MTFGRWTLAVAVALGSVAAAQDPEPKAEGPSIADQYRAILAEYKAQQKARAEAVDAAQTEAEAQKLRGTMTPDDTAYSRRMVDLAKSAPKDPAARDALVWVLDKPYRDDSGDYGEQFLRAVRELVNNFADDPEAVRVALTMNNIHSYHRDALMDALYVCAEGREAKGLARMALAQYLETKARMTKGSKTSLERRTYRFETQDDDGKTVTRSYTPPNDEQGYRIGLRLIEPETLLREAERLYEEVIGDYGDIPYITIHQRRMEAILAEPVRMWNHKPMTADHIAKVRAAADRRRTLAEVAEGHLDEIHNIAVGKPAPEIDGPDIDGRPMKLADFRGKVVVLSFWGSWCGPCMAKVPHERDLVAKYEGQPFALLGVACNEPAAASRKAMAAEKMTWPQWHDGDDRDGPIVETYHVRHYPTTFVIDAEGILRSKNARGEGLDQTVETLMKEMADTRDAAPAAP